MDKSDGLAWPNRGVTRGVTGSVVVALETIFFPPYFLVTPPLDGFCFVCGTACSSSARISSRSAFVALRVAAVERSTAFVPRSVAAIDLRVRFIMGLDFDCCVIGIFAVRLLVEATLAGTALRIVGEHGSKLL